MCFSFLFWPNKQGLRINLFLALGHRIWHVASLFGADCLREGWPYYLCLSRHKGLHIISTSTEMTYPHIHTLHPYCKKKCTCILRSAFDIFFPSIPYILQIPMAPMARRSCPWTSGCNWPSWSSPCLAAMRPKLCDWTRSGLGMVPWCPKCHPQLDFYSFSMMINDVPLPCWIKNDRTDWTSLSFPVPNPNATSPNQCLYHDALGFRFRNRFEGNSIG